MCVCASAYVYTQSNLWQGRKNLKNCQQRARHCIVHTESASDHQSGAHTQRHEMQNFWGTEAPAHMLRGVCACVGVLISNQVRHFLTTCLRIVRCAGRPRVDYQERLCIRIGLENIMLMIMGQSPLFTSNPGTNVLNNQSNANGQIVGDSRSLVRGCAASNVK